MNKKQQRELENKIWEAMEEPAELTPDEIAGIRERAHSAYLEKMENKQQPRTTQKKSGFLRRVVAVFAIAVGLMVLSVVYTVLAPVTVGNANSFVRRAVIWINDQLHLGISFPVPEDEESDIDSMTIRFFSSPQEAAEALNMPVAYFSNTEELQITGVDMMPYGDYSSSLFIRYASGEKSISIRQEPLKNDVYDLDSYDNDLIICPIGTIYVWSNDNENRAIVFYSDYVIQINSTVSKDIFENACQSLSIIN